MVAGIEVLFVRCLQMKSMATALLALELPAKCRRLWALKQAVWTVGTNTYTLHTAATTLEGVTTCLKTKLADGDLNAMQLGQFAEQGVSCLYCICTDPVQYLLPKQSHLVH